MGNLFSKKKIQTSPPTPPRASVMEPDPIEAPQPIVLSPTQSTQITETTPTPYVDEKYVPENLPSSSETSTSSSPSTATLVDQIPHYVTPLIPNIIQVQPENFPPSLESSRKQSLEEGEIFVPPTMLIVSPRTSISLQDPLEPIEECVTTESNTTPTA